jgi:hypothetical protein
MKRVSVFAVVGSLLLVSGISPVNAAIKAGDVCKKSGQISTVKGIKYTCIKSGKKLIWSKDVKTPTATPTAVPAKALTLDNLDYEQVYIKSRAEVAKFVASGVTSDGVIDFQAGANVDPWRIDIAKVEVNSAVKLWSSFFKPSAVTIIWYSSKDIPWAKARYEAAGGNLAAAVGFAGCTSQYCGNASASLMGSGKFLFEQGLEFRDQGLWNRSTAAHEYTHLAQYGLSGTANMNSMPWWSVEGGAQFYGEAIGYTPFDSTKSTRSGIHTQYTSDSVAYIATLFPGATLKSLLAKNDPEVSKKLMKSVEVSNNSQGALGLSYLLGSYATEVLVVQFICD